jgi:hypothetical protein
VKSKNTTKSKTIPVKNCWIMAIPSYPNFDLIKPKRPLDKKVAIGTTVICPKNKSIIPTFPRPNPIKNVKAINISGNDKNPKIRIFLAYSRIVVVILLESNT